ncbi:MAG: hypothetical protein J7J31_02005 [Helicobacteraceae bacterium]|nr:hypothetical protein [Helicobacteraceae bacterium]
MNSKELIVVGIGSSAGGLEALQIVLAKISNVENCAFIIAQHLSPTHKSMMTELLSRITKIPVIEVKNGMKIKKHTIYMTPENSDVYVAAGKIFLTNIEQTYGPKPSINYLFNSLAEAFGSKAMGIILSGTGSDGAFGIRAIKANGGITIAQSPATAKYDGMPVSAINTGKVDLVVSVDNISEELHRIVHNLESGVVENINESITSQMYQIIFDEKGVDFSQYKKSTLVRRIQRRLATLKIASLAEYVQHLRENKEEITNLYNDILIGVTEFFRDKDVFEKVQEYLETIVEKKEQGEEIRLWCIGCSTGEEAYSLAILLHEILQEKISKYKIKIFATDIDDEALKIARAGIYAETSLVNIKKEYRERYFTIAKNQFEIKKSIRELVIFSKHNITSDSPFLRIDYLSCRNMLIYFNQNLQDRFFPIVHYALKENGILTLGLSESLGGHLELFIPLEKKHNIYKAQYTGIKEAPKLYNYNASYHSFEDIKPRVKKNEEEFLEESIVEGVLNMMLNQCALINSSHEIVYIKGKIPYIEQPQGRATNNIFKCINQDLSLELRTALNEAVKTKTMQSTPVISIVLLDSIEKYLKIAVVPIKNENNGEYLYALFFQTEKLEHIYGFVSEGANENETIEKLKLELTRTKAHLQNVIEELETSYEEMQSLNEELSSSNEELQSSNEELETTNEELQSTNEELQTAYSELKILYDDKEDKAKKLQEVTQSLQAGQEAMKKQQKLTDTIIESVPVGVIMLDGDGRLSVMNQNAKDILLLDEKDDEEPHFGYDAQGIIEQNLPFEIVKKTHEPIYKVEHTIEKEGLQAIFITVNGVPLFNHQGEFIGAVFSIVDNLSTENLSASVRYAGVDEQSLSEEEQFSMVKLGLLDIASNLQSYVSDLSFFTQALSQGNVASDVQIKLQENINKKINEITTIIASNVNYYKELFVTEKSSFFPLLKRYIKILKQTFAEEQLFFEESLGNKIFLECRPRETSTFLLELFSGIFTLVKKEIEQKEVFIDISYQSKQNTLVISIKGLELIQENLDRFRESMPSTLKKSGIKGLHHICIQDLYEKSICI